MILAALEAAEYATIRIEERIDATVGRSNRKLIGRYAVVSIVAVPIAYIGAGFAWTATATAGYCAGIGLLAIIDVTVAIVRKKASRR